MKRSNIDAMICRQEKITDITRKTINKIQLDKLNAVLKKEKEKIESIKQTGHSYQYTISDM